MAAAERTSELLERARKIRLSGALDEAGHCFRQLLEDQPQNLEALRELGVICLLRGRPGEALGVFNNALKVQPGDVVALLGRANALFALKRYRDAVAGFDAALKVKTDSPEAHHNRAAALGALGRHAEALEGFEKAIELNPNYVDAYRNRGSALRALGRSEEALMSFNRASELRPSDPNALLSKARTLSSLVRSEEALAQLDRVLETQPDLLEAHVQRGQIFEKTRRYDEALACCDRAIALRPTSPELHVNRAVVLRKLDRHEDAIKAMDRVLAIRPADRKVLLFRARSLVDLGRFEDALRAYDKVMESNSDWVDGMVAKAFALTRLGRFDEALKIYDRALLFEPDSVPVRSNRALALLMVGDFVNGLKEAEWRLERRDRRKRLRMHGGTRWLGQEDLFGKRILVYSEQGLGDTLHFVRYVPLLAKTGARVILKVPAPLVPLLRGFPGTEAVLGPEDPFPPFDLHSPLMSLPLALGTRLDTIPANIPYISPKPDRDKIWKERLGPPKAPRIGIVWSGNPNFTNDRTRSLTLEKMLPLASAGVELVSLQKELRDVDLGTLRANPQIRHFGEQLNDFADTASLISLMDLVISSDTSVPHLAGAMGKPLWLMLSFSADWRWLLEREDSPWYPTARLFRQKRIDDWDGMVQRVTIELGNYLARTKSSRPSGTIKPRVV